MNNLNKKRLSQNGKRECELKFEIENESMQKQIAEKLNKLGFKFVSKNLESDYCPDVEGFLCKANGVMLRFRTMEGTDNKVLVTLKIKNENAKFADNYEIEFFLNEFDEAKFNSINKILQTYANKELPKTITSCPCNINEIIEFLSQHGFNKLRIFSQKKRSEFKLNNIKITIDEFPAIVGTYLEIEAENFEDLKTAAAMLGFNCEKAITTGYGKIIKEKQAHLPEDKQRICIFN